MKKIFLPILLVALISSVGFSQKTLNDSTIKLALFSIHYGRYIPGQDLAERFGQTNNIGVGLGWKTKKNWFFNAEYTFFAGEDIKNESNYFHAIRNSNGYIIDGNGMFAEVFLYERGFHVNAQIGKQFNFLSPNPNSGPFIHLGVGLLQHKVRIENLNNVAYQIAGDYKEGYDRLTNGVSFSQMIGYRYLSDKRLVNFYVAFEFTQAFTQCRRSFNIDDMKRDDTKRLDLMSGLRIGWILPLYEKAPKEFYYF